MPFGSLRHGPKREPFRILRAQRKLQRGLDVSKCLDQSQGEPASFLWRSATKGGGADASERILLTLESALWASAKVHLLQPPPSKPLLCSLEFKSL